MIVVDVLLALNLVLFVVCAVRAPRPGRSRIDDLVTAARQPAPALAMRVVPIRSDNVVVPFRSREELRIAHARAAHPSSGASR